MGNRTEKPGHTGSLCSTCADKERAKDVARMREKRGTTKDPKDEPGKRGPRDKAMSTLNRSDVHAPSKYKHQWPGQRKASWPDMPLGTLPPKQYGTLTIEDIHAATSALPLKPPGK